MAKKVGFITIDKTAGNGNDTIKVSADANTGRDARSGKVVITSAGGVVTQVGVQQDAHDIYADLTSTTTVSAEADTVTVSGKSNAGFALLKVGVETLPRENYVLKANGQTIAGNNFGDLGAGEAYDIEIKIRLTPNTGAQPISTTFNLVCCKTSSSPSRTFPFTVIQSAAPSELSANPTAMTFSDDTDTPQEVEVSSNDNWTADITID